MKHPQLPQDEWISLKDAVSLGSRVGQVPELVARERVIKAVIEGIIPRRVSDLPIGQWRDPACDERPKYTADINIKDSGFICRSVMVTSGRGAPNRDMYVDEMWLFVRISWPTFLDHYFPGINYAHVTKERGGRPPKWDWAAFNAEVGLWIFENGLPTALAELNRHMVEWCQRHWGDEPEDSALRSHVKLVVEAYRKRLPTAKN
jgi:hypothetical protein